MKQRQLGAHARRSRETARKRRKYYNLRIILPIPFDIGSLPAYN
jgi:hypothetical protein